MNEPPPGTLDHITPRTSYNPPWSTSAMITVLLVPSVMLARLILPLWPNADWRYWLESPERETLTPVRVSPANPVVSLGEDHRAERRVVERIDLEAVLSIARTLEDPDLGRATVLLAKKPSAGPNGHPSAPSVKLKAFAKLPCSNSGSIRLNQVVFGEPEKIVGNDPAPALGDQIRPGGKSLLMSW